MRPPSLVPSLVPAIRCVLLLFGAVFGLTQLHAQTALDLTGATVTYAWRFGASSNFASNGIVNSENPTFVVGSGVEVPATFFNQASANITGSNLVFQWTTSSAFSGNVFNGSQLILGSSFGTITGATINSTNMSGFDSSRVSVTNGELFINFQGLSFTPSTVVSLSVQGTSAIPEPGQISLALAVIVLGATALVRHRRKSSV